MAVPLDGITLPYSDEDTPAPASKAPAPVVAASSTELGPTHPDVDKIKVPYDENAPLARGATE